MPRHILSNPVNLGLWVAFFRNQIGLDLFPQLQFRCGWCDRHGFRNIDRNRGLVWFGQRAFLLTMAKA
ncbi:UNVERIFIED_CONTAM: hypothetical protein Sangu_2153700 [Sesamum angustifolium]|uniref:Uncharacterized protein n=1 Tax=Sesamum angustifolium TaxID=2727405 RepID=A0AAW2LG04_9LAMI